VHSATCFKRIGPEVRQLVSSPSRMPFPGRLVRVQANAFHASWATCPCLGKPDGGRRHVFKPTHSCFLGHDKNARCSVGTMIMFSSLRIPTSWATITSNSAVGSQFAVFKPMHSYFLGHDSKHDAGYGVGVGFSSLRIPTSWATNHERDESARRKAGSFQAYAFLLPGPPIRCFCLWVHSVFGFQAYAFLLPGPPFNLANMAVPGQFMFSSLRIPTSWATVHLKSGIRRIDNNVFKPTHSYFLGHSGVQKTLTSDELYMRLP
jgi:hypothetical protein